MYHRYGSLSHGSSTYSFFRGVWDSSKLTDIKMILFQWNLLSPPVDYKLSFKGIIHFLYSCNVLQFDTVIVSYRKNYEIVSRAVNRLKKIN